MISNIIKQAAIRENTEQLKTFWLKKYTELTENNYFVLSPKTIELAVEKEVIRPATPFGDLVLMTHLDETGEINENLLQNNIEVAVRLLDACLDVIAFDKNSIKVINQYRKIGLGIADFGQYYKNLKRENNQTSEAEEIEYIGNLISNNAYRSSESLSEEKGICQNWDNIKKILRDKPFEYWYNTENGDIKTSSEMVANFDQNRVEASDFEIVPRRNSHIMLLPAIDEWQVWSDRSSMTISQLTNNSNNLDKNSSGNLDNSIQKTNLSNSKEIGQNQNSENLDGQSNMEIDSNNSINSNQILQNNSNNYGENGKHKTTIISFPKNKTEKTEENTQNLEVGENSKEINQKTDQDINQEKNLEEEKEEKVNISAAVAKNEEKENSLNLKSPVNSSTNSAKLEYNEVLEETGKLINKGNSEGKPELEIQNSQNFFEKPTNSTNLEKSETELETNKGLEFVFQKNEAKPQTEELKMEKLENSKIENQSDLEKINKLDLPTNLEKENEQKIQNSQIQNTKFENSFESQLNSNGKMGKNPNLSIENEEINEEIKNNELKNNQESFEKNPLADEFQLGELVRIVKIDSPSFGQIQQIIEIDEQNSEQNLNKLKLKLSGINNQNLIFGQNEIEPMDLHAFLDQTNFANEKLAKTENQNLDQINQNNQENSQILSQNEHGNLQKYSEEIANLENKIKKINEENATLKQEKIQNLAKIQTLENQLETQINNEKLQKVEFEKVIKTQKSQIDKLNEELNSTRQELKNVPNLESQNNNSDKSFDNVNFANLSSNAQPKNTTNFDKTNESNSENQNHAQELQNLLHQNNSENNSQNSEPNFTNKITNNFFKLQNKFISFMSKYSLQLQQLASTNGQFKLGDILITLQYDGSGVKLVSASGDQLSKELKHMVDTVLGIVNKALAFGVPANELAKQMKLEPKDDETQTPLNHILAVVAAALEEAPGQIQNLKADSLFGIDKDDVEVFTTTVKSDSMSILMSKLQNLKANKSEMENNISNFERNSDNNDDKSKENPQFATNSDQKFEPKIEEKPETNSPEKPQNNNNSFERNENSEENPFSNTSQTNTSPANNSQNQNNQNTQSFEEEKPAKQEEKPRSFFGGFGGRN